MKEKAKVIYVHLGPHKTGTTAIQKYLYKSNYVNLLNRKDIQLLLLEPTKESYNFKAFEAYLEANYSENKFNLISDEELSGNIHCGGNGGLTFFETISRLKMLSNFKVVPIYVCRNGPDACFSAWKQYVKKGGKRSYKWYVSKDFKRRNFRFPKFNTEHYIYKNKIEFLWDKFGHKDVKIIKYSKNIVSDFCDSISIPVEQDKISNENISDFIKDYTLARYMNYLVSVDEVCEQPLIVSNKIYGIMKQLNKIKLFNDEMKYVTEELKTYYQEDSKWLDKIIHISADKNQRI